MWNNHSNLYLKLCFFFLIIYSIVSFEKDGESLVFFWVTFPPPFHVVCGDKWETSKERLILVSLSLVFSCESRSNMHHVFCCTLLTQWNPFSWWPHLVFV
ncbi:hypothetical protein BT93_D2091 [Corymbia citriodora subsp. variegata]|nr:hypothetical protein BT93_D2091 [Corymbia citriodora subsp. variegata]